MQEAIAIGLEQAGEKQFFEKQLEAYTERRDILTSYFDQLGLSYTKPDGSYFLLVDMSPVKIPEGFEPHPSCKGRGKDFTLCWWLAQELKVVGIPPSEVSYPCEAPKTRLQLISQFYSKDHEHIGERFARFAFVSHHCQNHQPLIL